MRSRIFFRESISAFDRPSSASSLSLCTSGQILSNIFLPLAVRARRVMRMSSWSARRSSQPASCMRSMVRVRVVRSMVASSASSDIVECFFAYSAASARHSGTRRPWSLRPCASSRSRAPMACVSQKKTCRSSEKSAAAMAHHTPDLRAFATKSVCYAPRRRRRYCMPGVSRRSFLIGLGVAAAGCAPTPASRPSIRYRLGLSQPLDSPNYLRLKEMADRVRAETEGAMQIEVHGASVLGSDNQMLAMVQKGELELYMAGNVWGPLVPVTEMPGLPFTFKNTAAVFAALDADMGDHIRGQLAAKGIHQFRLGFDNGFHQLTTRTRPIRTVEDLAGMPIRTPFQKMTVDFFESIGAKPKTFTLNQLYQVLKDQTVDGQTDPYQIIVLLKLYEVQTYLSISNHWWSGFTLNANLEKWNALPADIRAVITKHADAAALAQREDVARIDAGALEVLRAKGMIVNETDTSGFRRQLGAFYARWKAVYGDKAWALLEARVGRLI